MDADSLNQAFLGMKALAQILPDSSALVKDLEAEQTEGIEKDEEDEGDESIEEISSVEDLVLEEQVGLLNVCIREYMNIWVKVSNG